jgi:integrase
VRLGAESPQCGGDRYRHKYTTPGAAWWTTFGSEETKNKRPIEIPLPSDFSPWIDRYLEHYWPLLARCSSPSPTVGDAFWISDSGKPLTSKEVGQRVDAVTKRELGRPINVHLFRKVIPTELAIRDPGHVGIAQPLLGHADYRTTQQAYNLGRALEAARQHHRPVQSIRAVSSSRTGPNPATPVKIAGLRSPPRKPSR